MVSRLWTDAVTVLFGLPIRCRAAAFPSSWLINAIRIAAHGIAGDRIGPRTASAADRFELARATFPLDLRIVADAQEQGRVAIDIEQGLRADVTSAEGQKAAGMAGAFGGN